MTSHFPITISQLPIKYHLSFTKMFENWLIANNLANGKWLMVNGFGGVA